MRLRHDLILYNVTTVGLSRTVSGDRRRLGLKIAICYHPVYVALRRIEFPLQLGIGARAKLEWYGATLQNVLAF